MLPINHLSLDKQKQVRELPKDLINDVALQRAIKEKGLRSTGCKGVYCEQHNPSKPAGDYSEQRHYVWNETTKQMEELPGIFFISSDGTDRNGSPIKNAALQARLQGYNFTEENGVFEKDGVKYTYNQQTNQFEKIQDAADNATAENVNDKTQEATENKVAIKKEVASTRTQTYDDGSYSVYEEDSDGNTIKRTDYNADGSVQGTLEREYYEDGTHTDTSKNAEGTVTQITDFDNENRVIHNKWFDNDGNLTGTAETEYKDGIEITTEKNANGEVTGKYEFDSNKNQWVYQASCFPDGTIKDKTVYEYHEDGSHTATSTNYNGVVYSITEYGTDGNIKTSYYNDPVTGEVEDTVFYSNNQGLSFAVTKNGNGDLKCLQFWDENSATPTVVEVNESTISNIEQQLNELQKKSGEIREKWESVKIPEPPNKTEFMDENGNFDEIKYNNDMQRYNEEKVLYDKEMNDYNKQTLELQKQDNKLNKQKSLIIFANNISEAEKNINELRTNGDSETADKLQAELNKIKEEGLKAINDEYSATDIALDTIYETVDLKLPVPPSKSDSKFVNKNGEIDEDAYQAAMDRYIEAKEQYDKELNALDKKVLIANEQSRELELKVFRLSADVAVINDITKQLNDVLKQINETENPDLKTALQNIYDDLVQDSDKKINLIDELNSTYIERFNIERPDKSGFQNVYSGSSGGMEVRVTFDEDGKAVVSRQVIGTLVQNAGPQKVKTEANGELTVGGKRAVSTSEAIEKYSNNTDFANALRGLEHCYSDINPNVLADNFTVLVGKDDNGDITFSFCMTSDIEDGDNVARVYEPGLGIYTEECPDATIQYDRNGNIISTVINGTEIKLTKGVEYDELAYDRAFANYQQQIENLNNKTNEYRDQLYDLDLKAAAADNKCHLIQVYSDRLDELNKELEDAKDPNVKANILEEILYINSVLFKQATNVLEQINKLFLENAGAPIMPRKLDFVNDNGAFDELAYDNAMVKYEKSMAEYNANQEANAAEYTKQLDEINKEAGVVFSRNINLELLIMEQNTNKKILELNEERQALSDRKGDIYEILVSMESPQPPKKSEFIKNGAFDELGYDNAMYKYSQLRAEYDKEIAKLNRQLEIIQLQDKKIENLMNDYASLISAIKDYGDILSDIQDKISVANDYAAKTELKEVNDKIAKLIKVTTETVRTIIKLNNEKANIEEPTKPSETDFYINGAFDELAYDNAMYQYENYMSVYNSHISAIDSNIKALEADRAEYGKQIQDLYNTV